jgi:DNA-directed RNA polymerase subunit RPC12/RpoP
MPLFDDVRQAALDITEKLKECPRCGKTLDAYEIPKKKRNFQVLECSTCHLRIEVKTRNNDRIVTWGIGLLWIGAIAFVIGTLLGA